MAENTDQDGFGNLKEEARRNVDRITETGQEMHSNTMRLFVQPGLDLLAQEKEPDERCGTCAARTGTVPAGCVQTQADFLKAVCEDVPFMCHAHEVDGKFDRICHGWLAARIAMGDEKFKAPWSWSHDAEKEALAQAGDDQHG